MALVAVQANGPPCPSTGDLGYAALARRCRSARVEGSLYARLYAAHLLCKDALIFSGHKRS